LIDQIDAADPEHVEHFAPNFELHRAKEAFLKVASSPGTGVAPTVDGYTKPVRVQKRMTIPKPKKKLVLKRGQKVRVR
jgi:hypothetical protein